MQQLSTIKDQILSLDSKTIFELAKLKLAREKAINQAQVAWIKANQETIKEKKSTIKTNLKELKRINKILNSKSDSSDMITRHITLTEEIKVILAFNDKLTNEISFLNNKNNAPIGEIA